MGQSNIIHLLVVLYNTTSRVLYFLALCKYMYWLVILKRTNSEMGRIANEHLQGVLFFVG